MRHLIISCITLLATIHAQSQDYSVSIGTDIPYQHYIAGNLELENIDISYRTGILVPPYSDAILGIIENLGTDAVYINLLDASFESGWMNSLGAYYKFGDEKSWYAGTEFRLDHLSAADSPLDIIEIVTGISANLDDIIKRKNELNLKLRMLAVGLRFGKTFPIGANDKHFIKTEISVSKYVQTQSTLKINERHLDRINEELDDLLWNNVFKPNGFVGGIGAAYSFKF